MILFYLFYLGIIWSFVISMIRLNRHIGGEYHKANRHLYFSNMLLASGDTAMFLAFVAVFLLAGTATDVVNVTKYLQLLLFGVFSTSITMSIYYLFLGFYYKDRFNRSVTEIILVLALVFFVIRILLHYNPDNIWFSMMLPPGEPNISAWIRNVPLFLYGLLVVVLIAVAAWRAMNGPPPDRHSRYVFWAMVCLLFSFLFYALDVFAAHIIPKQYIWIIYTLKTLAYMGAFLLLWYGEFYLRARKQPEAKAAALGG